MSLLDLEFHHLGLAVKRPDRAIQFLEANGYEVSLPVEDPIQKVSLVMCEHSSMPDVEIISPLGDIPGPVDKIIKKYDSGIYHQCYVCDSIEETAGRLEGIGPAVMCVAPQEPAILFGGRKVAFYQVMGFGLIELLER